MKPALFTLLLFLSTVSGAETTYPIDPRLRDLEDQLKSDAEACRANGGGSYCERTARTKLERGFPFRGSRQYVRRFYLPMDTRDLLKTRDELREHHKAARSEQAFWVSDPRPAGELTKEMLQSELNQIDKELEVRRRKGKQQLREVTNDLKRVLK